jgi:DNA-binding IclR family transcriptional regulator
VEAIVWVVAFAVDAPAATVLQLGIVDQVSTDKTRFERAYEGSLERYTIAALKNGLEVLECFEEREAWTLSELVARLDVSKGTVFRVLATLETRGFIERRPPDGKYVLGARLTTIAAPTVKYEQLRWSAIPPLTLLAEAFGESAHIGVLYERRVVTVQVVDGHHDVRMHSSVGKRSPAHASSIGKAILATYGDPEIDEYLEEPGLEAHTPHTITDPVAFRNELRDVRASGYAVDDEEVQLGVRCVGAAIYNQTGRAVAGISVSGPTNRMTDERVVQMAPKVRQAARAISRMLGAPVLM